MSVSYDYLNRMFNRLHEARDHYAHHINKPQPKLTTKQAKDEFTRTKNMLEGTALAIEYSIRDYLNTHGGSNVSQ